MVIANIAKLLLAWGYIKSALPKADELQEAIRDFQKFNGIKPDGVVGPVTTRAIENRFCAVADYLPMLDAQCRWNNPKITWTVVGNLPNQTKEAVIAAFDWAWKEWAKHCNINPTYVQTQQEAQVIMSTGQIDSAGRTLAWSELVTCPNTPKMQKYDTSEPWGVVFPIPPQTISLQVVAVHEIGHVLGWGHDSTPGEPSILKPIYDPRVTKLQPIDIRRAVEVYGSPSTPPPPPPTNQVEVIVRAGNDQYRGNIPKVAALLDETSGYGN